MADPTAEDALLQRVLAVTLDARRASPSADPPIVHLSGLAQELETDAMGSAEGQALLLSRDLLDRVIVTRLIEAPPDDYPQWPLHYLLGCYARCSNELRSRGVSDSPQLTTTVAACKELVISYASLLLMAGIVPQPNAAVERGSLQLLDSITALFASSAAPGVVPMPPGFLEEFATKYESEGLDEVLRPVVKELAWLIRKTSPLGDYATPLSIASRLVKIEPIARVLVGIREWLPNLQDVTGRGIELPGSSWLGPCFTVSPIPDTIINSQPSVTQQCFSDFQNRRQGEIVQSMTALRMASKQIHNELHAIVKSLLSKGTRDAMVRWLGAVMEGNMERAKMQMDPEKAASHGFFVNLNAVLLKLCAPFMDPSNPNFWKRVDVSYVANNPHISFAGETKLAATADEDAAWRERVASSQSTSSSAGATDYHFICEAFFMTLKSLHLGVVKIINETMDSVRWLQDLTRRVQELEEEVQTLAAGTRRHLEAQAQLARIKPFLKGKQEERLAIETVLSDPDFMGEVIAFYRLVAAWMLQVACPSSQGSASMVQLPLPTPAPAAFATLPEYFVEDMADVLIFLSRAYPHIIAAAKMEETMLFLVVFMGSPDYIKSSHLRSKLSEVIHVWLPHDDVRPQFSRRGPRQVALGSNLTYLFQGHPTVLQHLVPTLLRLYVDVEFTDRHNQFYQKFQMRQYIGDILQYLWSQPPHREAWRALAAREGQGTGIYVRFCNMLITDSIYLLDESMRKLQELKEKETLMADPLRWQALSDAEHRETAAAAAQTGDHLRSLLYLARGAINTMNFSTQEVTAPFLLPEMVERVAGMLDYFLKYLTGSERRRLAIKEPEKYNFKPRELLLQIIEVYLHLAAADSAGLLARAIAEDARSYRPEMFPEAAKVLGSAGLLPPDMAAQLDLLARRVQEAAAEAQDQEDLLKDVEIPSEFQDPLMASLMTDPVLLPTGSKLIMDRAQIVRHLLSDQRDPITREPLTPDMLIPQTELKARIHAWISEQRRQKRQAAGANGLG